MENMSFKKHFVLLLVLAISACTKSKPQVMNNGNNSGLYKTSDIAFIENGRLSKEDRIQAAKDLFRSMEQSYVLWPYKEELIGESPAEIRDSCIATEAALVEASYRSDFVDRMLICIGRLKDSHLTLGSIINQSEVFTLVAQVQKIGNRFYIAQNRPQLIDYWQARYDQFGDSLQDDLKIGNEVLSVNGLPIQQEVDRLKKFNSGSSIGTVELWSTWAIFRRNYSFPTENFLSLEVIAGGKKKLVSIPWYYNPNENLETDVLLGQRGLISADDIFVTLVDGEQKAYDFSSASGPSPYKPLYSSTEVLNQEVYFKDEKTKKPFVTFARLKSPQDTCYLKIHTFSIPTKNAKVYASDKSELSLTDLISKFKSQCTDNSTQIILDLRSNPGGNTNLATELASLLIDETTKVSFLESYITNKFMWPLIEGWRLDAYQDTNTTENDIIYNSFVSAIQSNAANTDWVLSELSPKPITSAKMKVLTSPDCISSCEIFTRLIRKTSRTTIIGEAQSGTGAGFLSSNTLNTTYSDRMNLFSIEIPNFLFSVTDITGLPSLPFDKRLIIENQPVQPDIPYSLTLKDITDNFADLKALLAK